MNVSVSGPSAIPGIERYCPRTTRPTSIGRIDRNTLFFSSLIDLGSSEVGGSKAMDASTWNRWVTTMSRKTPVPS